MNICDWRIQVNRCIIAINSFIKYNLLKYWVQYPNIRQSGDSFGYFNAMPVTDVGHYSSILGMSYLSQTSVQCNHKPDKRRCFARMNNIELELRNTFYTQNRISGKHHISIAFPYSE